MMSVKSIRTLWVVSLLVGLSACQSISHMGHSKSVAMQGMDEEEALTEYTLGDPVSAQVKDVVYYFDYDNSQLRPEVERALMHQVKYLTVHPGVRVRIEGHTDEWGSREYNVALGWRRAHMISGYLRQMGVAKSQIEEMSYGKEKPAVLGHDPSSWQKNRRAVIVFKNRHHNL